MYARLLKIICGLDHHHGRTLVFTTFVCLVHSLKRTTFVVRLKIIFSNVFSDLYLSVATIVPLFLVLFNVNTPNATKFRLVLHVK